MRLLPCVNCAVLRGLMTLRHKGLLRSKPRSDKLRGMNVQHYLYFMQAKLGEGDSFRQWLLEDFGPSLAASDDCSGLCINVAVPSPEGELYRGELRVGEGYDATMDLSCPDAKAFARLMSDHGADLMAKTVVNYGYETRLSTEVDSPGQLVGNPLPGLKVMRGFFFFEDLPGSARIRSWDSHVELAKRIHGFARYVRYWIGAPVTPDTPRIGGATNLHFLSADDFVNQYFTVPDGATQIAQDISHFIDRGLARVFTREHRLK